MLKKLLTSLSMILATLAIFASASAVRAQGPAAETVVVFPFENQSNHPEYNWIGESFADSMSTLLNNKSGLIAVTSDERAVAYQRLRLPLTVLPSRATAIKIGRELKASLIVVGNFNVTLPDP